MSQGSSQAREHDKPPALIAGAFLADSTGVRSVCEDLADGLEAHGWEITRTSSVKSRIPRLLDMLSTVWLKRRRFAVAQMDVYSGAAFVWAEAVGASLSALRCPYAITLHSGAFPDFAERWPGRMRRLLQSATLVTSPSPFLARQLETFRSDIRVVRNGLNLERYPARRVEKARPRLVWIRAFERRYNPLLALEVLKRLADESPDAELLMVGPDRADWSAHETMQEARRLRIGDRVHVRGAVPKTEIPQILAEGDIFLNTTNVDNAPVTVVEAMACGLCVVSTDAGGVQDLVTNEHDALVVPRNDPAAMTAAVQRILVDPGLALRLSENARAVAEDYDWDRILSQWEDVLRGMAGTR